MVTRYRNAIGSSESLALFKPHRIDREYSSVVYAYSIYVLQQDTQYLMINFIHIIQ